MVDSPMTSMELPDDDAANVRSVKSLCRLMRDKPDVSAERLAEIRQKLESGAYLNRATAEESARHILDDPGIND